MIEGDRRGGLRHHNDENGFRAVRLDKTNHPRKNGILSKENSARADAKRVRKTVKATTQNPLALATSLEMLKHLERTQNDDLS